MLMHNSRWKSWRSCWWSTGPKRFLRTGPTFNLRASTPPRREISESFVDVDGASIAISLLDIKARRLLQVINRLLSMACPPAVSCSYTVVLLPLRTSLCSLDALRFYLWIKHLKDLEKEKDILYCGVEILEQARLWYHHQLEKNRARQDKVDNKSWVNSCQEDVAKARSFLLRSHMQRVKASLASLMAEPNDASASGDDAENSALRWQHTLLTQEVSHKNGQISMLEMEKDALLKQLYQQ
ncbi:suppressor APC domain-containing protein 2 [Festucalex cinctus]